MTIDELSKQYQEVTAKINELSITRERLIGAISILQDQQAAEASTSAASASEEQETQDED